MGPLGLQQNHGIGTAMHVSIVRRHIEKEGLFQATNNAAAPMTGFDVLVRGDLIRRNMKPTKNHMSE